MTICQNCKASLNCSCQRRVAVNGAQVCSNCVTSYNASLGGLQPEIKVGIPSNLIVNKDGVIETAPSNVIVGYRQPLIKK